MELTAININQIFEDCMFETTPKPGTKYIHSQGFAANVGLDPAKINKYSTTIKELLDKLDVRFNESSGGGQSLMDAGYDKNGKRWGGLDSAEQLMILGIASGWAKYLYPRNMWYSLSNGLPWFVVVNKQIKVKENEYAV